MKKKNKYVEILKTGDIGPLLEIIDLKEFTIKNVTETERIRIFLRFIISKLEKEEIVVEELIKNICLLEKAIANEIDGKHLVLRGTGKRYNAISSYDHYEIIISHGLRKMKIPFDKKKVLEKKDLYILSGIIWH